MMAFHNSSYWLFKESNMNNIIMKSISCYLNVAKQLGQGQYTIKAAKVLQELKEREYLISLIVSRRNIAENTMHQFQDLYRLDQEKLSLLHRGDTTLGNYFASYSKDKTKMVKMAKLGDEPKKKTVLELYVDGVLQESINLSKYHDDIMNDEMVGEPLQWDASSTKVVYIARLKAPEQKTFFQIEKDDEVEQAWNYRKYEQSWGERMDDVFEAGLFVYDFSEKTLFKVQLKKDILPAFPQFDQEGGLIFGGYQIKPEFKYGIIHCFNRQSAIYHAKKPSLVDLTNKKETAVQDSELSLLSTHQVSIKPKLSPNYKKLIYLATPLNHQHLSYLSLQQINMETNSVEELVSIPQENPIIPLRGDQEARNKLVYGVCGYYDDLLKTYWTKDSVHFLYPTMVGGQTRIIAINTITKETTNISYYPGHQHSQNLQPIEYDQEKDLLFCISDSLAQQPQLNVIFDVSKSLNGLAQQYHKVALTHQLPFSLGTAFKEEYIYSGNAEAFLWTTKHVESPLPNRKGDGKAPLIVLLHGGPHGAASSTYTIFRHMMLLQGFGILAPNFSGSSGYGQKYIEALSGRIGELDVAEIIDMIEQVKGSFDERNIFVMGGSYGGYLSIIMASQYGKLFNSAIILNPVSNLPAMLAGTDIPEWAASCALNKELSWNLTPEDYRRLFEASPMKAPIQIPSLLLLGAKDRRCPYYQSLALRAQTLANNVEIQTYVYPDSDHSLSDSLNTGYDTLIKMLLFIDKHFKD